MTDYFSYTANDGSIPDDAFRISPSQLSKFLDTTTAWYREQLLGEAGFLGSTASELGNVVHAAAHMYHNTGTVDRTALQAYITSLKNPEVDKSIITYQMKPMIEVLINQFLSKSSATHAEEFVSTQIIPGVYAAGSIDRYDEHTATVFDYKTMGSLDTARVPTRFPRSYYFQQLCYAYILRQQGRPVDFCKLVYVSRDNTGRISPKTNKPLKDYPSEVNIVTHQITAEDMSIIKNTLMLIAHSVKLWKAQPELRFALAQDFRLYQPPAPKIFKD